MNALNMMLLLWSAASLLSLAATALIVFAEVRVAGLSPAAHGHCADARQVHMAREPKERVPGLRSAAGRADVVAANFRVANATVASDGLSAAH